LCPGSCRGCSRVANSSSSIRLDAAVAVGGLRGGGWGEVPFLFREIGIAASALPLISPKGDGSGMISVGCEEISLRGD
jgi:hypothetical protein